MSKMIHSLIGLVSYLLFNRLSMFLWAKVSRLLMVFYGNYVRSQIKRSGSGFYVEYPVTCKGGEYISFGNNFSSRARLRIEAWHSYNGMDYAPEIIIGNNVVVNFDCHIGAIDKVHIGDNVLIGSRVLITDHNHGGTDLSDLQVPPLHRPLVSRGPVIIDDNVWIGEGVAILAGVRIGRNSIIGANSVVNVDVPDNSIAAGVPVKIIKQF